MNDIIGIADLSNVLIPEIGKIKVGEKGEEKTSKNNKKYRMPEKLDYFKVTTLERGEDGNFKEDEAVKGILKDEEPKELSIKVLHDDVNKVFPHWYAFYSGDRLVCKGDGKESVWHGYDDNNPARNQRCDGEDCKYRQNNKCKPHGIFSCTFQGMELVGGAYKFRTTSWNSIHGILSSLRFIKSLTGGILAELPLKMVLKPKTTTYESGGSKGITTVQVVHIEFDGSIGELQNKAVEIRQRRLSVKEKMDISNIDLFSEELSYIEEDKDDGEINYQNPALKELSDKAKEESDKVEEEINNKPTKSDKKEDKETTNLTEEQRLIIDTCNNSDTAKEIADNFLKMIKVESIQDLNLGQAKGLMNKLGIK